MSAPGEWAGYCETVARCPACDVALRDHQLTARVADCPRCGERYPLCGISAPHVAGQITPCCTRHTAHDDAHEGRGVVWPLYDWELTNRALLAAQVRA